jgi:hypothetical protein
MNGNSISMVQECVTSYVVHENADGSITVTIDVPKKYKELWMIKLSSLTVTEEELKEYVP